MTGAHVDPQLLDLIYSAAEDPNRWRDCLSALTAELEVDVAVLLSSSSFAPGTSITAIAGIEESAIREYERDWADKDLWLASRNPIAFSESRVFRGEEIVPNDTLQRSEFYNEWLKPIGLGRMFSTNLRNRAGERSVLAFNFSARQGPATDLQVSKLELLLPHLQRAIRLHSSLVLARETGTEILQALQLAPLGVLVLDAQSHIVECNQRGALLLGRDDGIGMLHGTLFADDARDNQRLKRQVTQACDASNPTVHGPAVVPVRRKRSAGFYSVCVCPIPMSAASLDPSRHRAIVLIQDPVRYSEIAQAMLRDTFGFSTREADVAICLARGTQPRDIAEQLSISYETVRTHLKSAFAKARVRSQPELVRTVLEITSMT